MTENLLGECLHCDETTRKQEEEIQSLIREKITLFDELLNLFRQYETKVAELTSIEETFSKSNFCFHDSFENEERKRDVVRQEVLHLQQSIRHVACDMKENEENVSISSSSLVRRERSR